MKDIKELVRKKRWARENGASQEFLDAIQRRIARATLAFMEAHR